MAIEIFLATNCTNDASHLTRIYLFIFVCNMRGSAHLARLCRPFRAWICRSIFYLV